MAAKATRRKRAPADHGQERSSETTADGPVVAQVRLRADEAAELQRAMQLLDLHSTSEALREGLKLLSREAAEVAAAEEIWRYYGGEAPLPDGVVPVDDADLAAADEAEW